MPELLVRTNVSKSIIKATILQDLTSIVANMLGKPEKSVCISVETDQWMMFGGTQDPCATCRLSSVNQLDNADSNRKYSKFTMDYLVTALGVTDNRIYLEFNKGTREAMGYKSDTLFGLLGPSK